MSISKGQGRTAVQRLLAFVLSLAMLFSLLPGVSATNGGTETNEPSKSYENLYMLQVDTGVSDGRSVLYIGVRYQDKNDLEHTEYIFPHEGSLQDSFRIASEVSSPDARLTRVELVTGYSLDDSYDDSDGLRANSSDMYLFDPDYQVKAFLGVDVFLSYSAGSDSNKPWSCSSIELYKVSSVYGLDMYGFYSDQFYVRFEGTRIAKLGSGSTTLSQLHTDEQYQIRMSKSDPYFMELTGEEPFSNRENAQFLLDVCFADTYKGGIEALATRFEDKHILKDPAEAITAAIYYKDTFGNIREADVPLITSALTYAYEQKYIGKNPEIVGIAQQGDDVLVPINLPHFASVEQIDLFRGESAAEQARISAINVKTRRERLNELSSEEIDVTGVYLYSGDTQILRDEEHPAMLGLRPDPNAKPLAAYESGGAEGISLGTTGTVLDKSMSRSDRTHYSQQMHYVVQITTDNYASAATTSDIQLQLTYRSQSGETKTTTGMYLSERALDFYGYWPGSSTEASYVANMTAGATLTFILPITDVYQFISGTFIMDTTSTDDWQMSEIAIYASNKIGTRVAEWKDVGYSDRVFTRAFTGTPDERVAWYPNLLDQQEESAKLYLSASEPRKTITFGSESHGGISENEGPVEWSHLRYSMSFEEAKQDLGFGYAAAAYTVDVKVAGDEKNAQDDAGSDNLFYFKLIFESGSSAYVLANQQLAADGFRAGKTETFTVTTNDDYGNLESVSIIPAFDSNNDKQNVFDKLNIDSITVSKAAGKGLTRTWVCHDVGWIDISYANSTSKDSNRTYLEGEIAKSCRVDSVGYGLELLFSLTTGSYDRAASEWGPDMETKNPQFEGTLVMSIEYQDADGIRQTKAVDAVKAMYQYAGMKPLSYAEGENATSSSMAVSDPRFMFRENHTDRFTVVLPNVTKILGVTLYAGSKNATSWKVQDLSVWQIRDDGVLQIRNDEYFRYVPKEEDLLCTSNNIGPYIIPLLAPVTADQVVGAQQKQPINVTDGTVTISKSDSTWTSTLTREPISFNDTLNVYVYMSKGGSATPIRNYDLLGAIVYYSTMDQQQHQVSTGEMLRDDSDEEYGVFYLPGLRAPGLAYIQKLALKVQDMELNRAPVDHVLIQHIRSGVVVDTIYMDLGNMDAQNTATWDRTHDSEPSRPPVTTRQTVKLFLGADTETLSLIPEVDDLAIALRYKTSGVAGSATYDSKYVFLSDLVRETTQEDGSTGKELIYPQVRPGLVIEIPFEELYLGKLEGIVLASLGKVHVTVDSACVAVTKSEDGDLVSWYSLADPMIVTTTPKLMQPTKDKVVPMTFRFTAEAPSELVTSGLDSGSEAPIRMTVTYVESTTEKVREFVVEDVRPYLMSGSFSEKQDGKIQATVGLFLRNVGNVRSIRVEPTTSDPYGSATWNLISAAYTAYIDGTLQGKEVEVNGKAVYGKPLTVVFNKILINLSAKYLVEETGVTREEFSDADGNMEFTLSRAAEVTITPKVIGSLEGYGFTVKAVLVVDGTEIPVNCVSAGKDSISFMPPENTSGSLVTYKIYVYSEEADAYFSTAVIHLESVEPQPTEPDPTEPEPTKPDPTEPEPTEPEETEPEETEPTPPPTEDEDPVEETTPSEEEP